MGREDDARKVIGGDDLPPDELKTLAGDLRDSGRAALAEEMLIAVARRALKAAPPAPDGAAVAKVLRDHQQFTYARRLLGRVRAAGPDTEQLRQQHAFCTYKDLELPARRRLDRAFEILNEGGRLEESKDAETLGIAGAVLKRRWEVDAKRADLELAWQHYSCGFEQKGSAQRWYAGINAAFVADQLAAQELPESKCAQALKADALMIRQRILAELPADDEWRDATLGEAYFGVDRFEAAESAFAEAESKTKDLWRLETTAMQLAALARLRGVADDPRAVKALEALVGHRTGAVRRASLGKVGLALSGGGYRASLFHLGVLARLAECRVLRDNGSFRSCLARGPLSCATQASPTR